MKEMSIRATECDVCEEHKLCWHVSLADVCAACLETASAVIQKVDDFGFIETSTKAPRRVDARRGGGK
jgi:hypothetical protein